VLTHSFHTNRRRSNLGGLGNLGFAGVSGNSGSLRGPGTDLLIMNDSDLKTGEYESEHEFGVKAKNRGDHSMGLFVDS